MAAPKQYTDAQIAEYMAHVRDAAGAKYTPDQLKEYEQHVRDAVGPEAKGFKSDSPAEADLFGSDANRIYAGFGDPKGIQDSKLLSSGYSNVRRNSSGDLVAQGPDGKWYKDQSSFFKNPGNWLESAVGGAPSTAGMMAGGALGGGIPGAAAGSGLGEAIRGGLGQLGGVYSGKDRAADIANETAGGAAAELGGKIVGKIAKPIIDPIKSKASELWSALASKLSGVDKEDVLRTILNRGKVFNPKGTQEIAKAMADELAARQASESAAYRAANDAFDANDARKVVSTEPVVNASRAELSRAAPSQTGEGSLNPQEFRTLSTRSENNLVAPQVQATATTPTVPEKLEKPLRDLLKYRRGLDADIGRYHKAPGLPGDTPRDISFLEGEAGRVRDLIRQHSPSIAEADARFSKYGNQSDLLRPVMNEGAQQGFVDTLINSTKRDNARDAAEALVPKSYEDALDLGANRAWTKPGDKGFLGIPKRLAAQAALGTLGAEAARESHNPWLAVPGAVAAAAISPRGNREFIRMGIPMMKQIPAAMAKPVIKRFSPFNVEDSEEK